MTIPYNPKEATETPEGNRPVLESGEYNATMTACRVNDRGEYEIDWAVYNGSEQVYLRQWLNMTKGFHIHHLGCIAKHINMEQAYNDGTFNPAAGVNRNFKLRVTKKPAKNNPGQFRNWVDGIDPTPAAPSASQEVFTNPPGGDHKPVDDSDIPF